MKKKTLLKRVFIAFTGSFLILIALVILFFDGLSDYFIQNMLDNMDRPSALTVAVVKADNQQVLSYFDKHPESINTLEVDGKYPILLAARYGNLELLKELLKRGANINIQARDSEMCGYFDKIRGERDWYDSSCLNFYTDGNTPLHETIRYQQVETAHFLLESKASVHLQNYFKRTPVFLASSKGSMPLVDLLLQHGAESTIEVRDDRDYQNAVEVAAEAGHLEVVKRLLPLSKNPSTLSGAYVWAMLKKQTQVVTYLESFKPDINQEVNGGLTILHLAIIHLNTMNPDIDLFKKILSLKPNINRQSEQGDTPLHLAIQKEKPELVQMLLDTGARIDLKDKNGMTPLSLAEFKKREYQRRRNSFDEKRIDTIIQMIKANQ